MRKQQVSMVGKLATATMLTGVLALAATGCAAPASTSGSSSSSSPSASSTSTTLSASSSSSSQATSSWPDNANTADVPRPTFAGEPFVLDEGDLTSFSYLNISEADARAYLDELKAAGFTSVEANTDGYGSISYVARNPQTGTHLSFSYSTGGGSLTVALDRFGV